MSSEKDIALFMAEIFEYTGRFDDMIYSIKKVVDTEPKLDQFEQIMFKKAFEHQIQPLLKTLDIIGSIYKNEQLNGNISHIEKLNEYKVKILSELRNICDEAIGLIDFQLLPVSNDESYVFYETCKGKFYRYLCYYLTDDEKTETVCKAKECYEKAISIAEYNIPPNNLNYHFLYLDYTIFIYEILNHKKEAIKLASDIVQKCFPDHVDYDNEEYDKEVFILHIMIKNIHEWKENID